MKKIISLLLFISLFVIITFLLFADFEQYVEMQLNQTENMLYYSVFSFVFLLSDIALPIPSSLIMILNGKVLGFFLGTALSLVAGLASSSLGFFLGNKSEKYLNKLFSSEEVARSNQFMDKYGKLAVALSRAIPILSESIAVLSGTTQMKFSSFITYSLIGHLVVSLVYAWVGAFTAELNGHIITVVVVISTLFISWLFSRLMRYKVYNRNN